jgi:hypothetical protein
MEPLWLFSSTSTFSFKPFGAVFRAKMKWATHMANQRDSIISADNVAHNSAITAVTHFCQNFAVLTKAIPVGVPLTPFAD